MEETRQDVWRDIKDEFLDATSRLELGEMIHSEQLTLLDLMSAIQLMNPKTDSGHNLGKCSRTIYNLQQSIDKGVIKVEGLDPAELIGIFDDTFACLCTWLDGNSLGRTVFTNLYLHDPGKVQDECLKNFSLAILKIVEFIQKLIDRVYPTCVEDEDFIMNKLDLQAQVNPVKLLSTLECLCQQYDKLASNSTGNKSTAKQKQKNAVGVSKQQRAAIANRYRFLLNLYAFFFKIHRDLLSDANWDLNHLNGQQMSKTLQNIRNSVDTCDKHLDKCIRYLKLWSNSINLGVSPKSLASNGAAVNDCDYPVIMGFEPHINHKAQPASYPYYPKIKTRQETIAHLDDLLKKFKRCIAIHRITERKKSFNDALYLLDEFGRHFKPSSCVVSRSFLQVLYIPTRSKALMRSEIEQAYAEFMCGLENCQNIMRMLETQDRLPIPSLDMSQYLSDFYDIKINCILNCGRNPARQHEKLGDLIRAMNRKYHCGLLPHIQSSFKEMHEYIIGRSSLAKYITLGLELDIYAHYELPYVYFVLYKVYDYDADDAKTIVRKYEKNDAKSYEERDDPVPQRYLQNVQKRYLEAVRRRSQRSYALSHITHAMYLLCHSLNMLGLIKVPETTYTNRRLQFKHRFNELGFVDRSICNEALALDTEFSSRRNSFDAKKNLQQSLDYFDRAKHDFENYTKSNSDVDEDHLCPLVSECMQVCHDNRMFVDALVGDLNGSKQRQIDISFEVHPSFPIVKLKH